MQALLLVSGNTCQISLKDDPINTRAATNDFNVTLPTVFVKISRQVLPTALTAPQGKPRLLWCCQTVTPA